MKMKVSPLMFMVGAVLVLQLIILLVLLSKKNTKEGFETEEEKKKREQREGYDKTCRQKYLTMTKTAFENLSKQKKNDILTNINNCRKARRCEGLTGNELNECNKNYDGNLTLEQISNYWG